MFSLTEAVEDRRHDLVERQAARGRELGCVAHLGVHHVVRREILRALGGDALESLWCLEQGDRVSKAVEVELEALAVGTAGKPGGELVRVARRQFSIAGFGGELEDRLRSQPPVEMVVQERLRRRADRFELEQLPLP
jgi:hypothetical protein